MELINDKMREILAAYAENGRKYAVLTDRINTMMEELAYLNGMKNEVLAELSDIRLREKEMFSLMQAEGLDVDYIKANIMEYVKKISADEKG
jgi:hypothetical protein